MSHAVEATFEDPFNAKFDIKKSNNDKWSKDVNSLLYNIPAFVFMNVPNTYESGKIIGEATEMWCVDNWRGKWPYPVADMVGDKFKAILDQFPSPLIHPSISQGMPILQGVKLSNSGYTNNYMGPFSQPSGKGVFNAVNYPRFLRRRFTANAQAVWNLKSTKFEILGLLSRSN